MSVRSDIFARNWVSENVFNVPGLADTSLEIERLSAKLAADAAAAGIGLDELADAVGDPWDYIEDAYLNVHDPDEGGFRDA